MSDSSASGRPRRRLKWLASNITERSTQGTNPVALEHIESWTGRRLDGERTFDSDGIGFAQGDVLFGKLRPYLAKAHVATKPGEAVGDFIVLRPNRQTLSPKFLGYFLLTPGLVDSVTASSYGSKMPRTNWDELSAHELDLPSLQEQRQIAAFLDHETALIDKLVSEQDRLIRLLLEKLEAISFRAVTRGYRRNELRESGVAWLGSIASKWVVAPIKTFARIESGHTPNRQVPAYWVDCKIPWVSLNDSKQLAVVDVISETAVMISEAGIAGSSARLLPERAVVFTRDATIGLAAITARPMAVSQHLIAWVCDEQKVLPEYLLLVFYAMRRELERSTFGATIPTIGMPDVRKLVAAFPGISEQAEIIDAAFAEKAELETSITTVRRLRELLLERRSALITAAVTGQIDVRSWRPDSPQEAVV